MPGRAGDHRPHEALVAGHVDDRQPPARRQLEARVAELDRDPPRALLAAGGRCRRRSARGPARSCRDRCARRCRASAARHRVRTARRAPPRRAARARRRSSVRGSSSTLAVVDPRDHGRLALAQRARRVGSGSASSAHHGPVELEQRQRAAADPRDGARHAAAGRRSRRASRRPARPACSSARRASPAPGSPGARGRGRGTAAASPRARPARACRSAAHEPAGARAPPPPPRGGRRAGRPAGRRAACRPSSRRARRRPRTERAIGGSSLSAGIAARVRPSTPEPTSSITGAPSAHSCLDLDLLRRTRPCGSSTGARA